MNTENKDSAPRVSVLVDIATRLAAITPEQFIAPSGEDDGGTVVCVATDDIKRLSTLCEMLSKELEELSKSGFTLCIDALNDLIARGPAAIAKELLTPEGRAKKMADEIRESHRVLQQKKDFAKIVDDIFWLELERQHPDLQDKPVIGIRSDWSICWLEDSGESYEMNLNLELSAFAGPGKRFVNGQKPN